MKKSVIALLLIAATLSLVLCSCSGTKLPEEPAVTALEKYTYVNPNGATAPAPENQADHPDVSLPTQYVETINNVEIQGSSYYVYGKNAASATVTEIFYDGFSVEASCFVDVKIVTIGKRSDDIKVGYTAYDAEGNIVRESYFLVKLDGIKVGDTVEKRRLSFPLETAKIVLHDYVELGK